MTVRQAKAWATQCLLTFKVGRQLFRLGAGIPFVITEQSNFIKARRDLNPCPQSPSLTLGSYLDVDMSGLKMRVRLFPLVSASAKPNLSYPFFRFYPPPSKRPTVLYSQKRSVPLQRRTFKLHSPLPLFLKTFLPPNPLSLPILHPVPHINTPSHVFIFLELQCSSWGRIDTSISSFGSSLAKV